MDPRIASWIALGHTIDAAILASAPDSTTWYYGQRFPNDTWINCTEAVAEQTPPEVALGLLYEYQGDKFALFIDQPEAQPPVDGQVEVEKIITALNDGQYELDGQTVVLSEDSIERAAQLWTYVASLRYRDIIS